MRLNTGYRREAAELDAGFVDAFEDYDTVVSPSASCVATIRHKYAFLADEVSDRRLAPRVAECTAKVYELTVFLVDVRSVTDVGAYVPHAVAYHPTCLSLRSLHLDGLVDLPHAEECCGFAARSRWRTRTCRSRWPWARPGTCARPQARQRKLRLRCPVAEPRFLSLAERFGRGNWGLPAFSLRRCQGRRLSNRVTAAASIPAPRLSSTNR